MNDKQIKRIKDRNQNIGLLAVAVVLILLIGKMNKNEQNAAVNAGLIKGNKVPYWMQK